MAKMRSPNYPAITLGEAIERVNLLWKKERRTPVPAEVAAKAIGYSGISGPARTALAALKKYGLVDSDDKTVKVSELAVSILHTPGDDSALPFLREAALQPELFRQLHANYRDASDDAIRSYLIAKLDFSDSGAAQAIKTFRATSDLAKLNGTEYNPQLATEDDSVETTQNANLTSSQQLRAGINDRSLGNVSNSATSQTFSWPLAPDVKAEVKITGGDIKPEHFDALQQYLNLAKTFVTTFAVGDTVEFEDAHSGETKYGKVTDAVGGAFVMSIISKEEAGPNPKRFTSRSDKRIVELTNGTGLINN